ncbi:MAG: hypothetical protein J2P15_07695 [Micromonosporaceae bacterium]|nr:hypothetical protein [Micromonosporaceae bacterium]
MGGRTSGAISYSLAEIRAAAGMWHRVSPQLTQIDAMVQGMSVRSAAASTDLFPSSIVKYAAIVANFDASCQEGAAITDAIGDTLDTAVLVYSHSEQAAKAAAGRLAQKIRDLGRLP